MLADTWARGLLQVARHTHTTACASVKSQQEGPSHILPHRKPLSPTPTARSLDACLHFCPSVSKLNSIRRSFYAPREVCLC